MTQPPTAPSTEIAREDQHLRELARTLAKSTLVPEALRERPVDIFAIISMGAELGIGPMRSLLLFGGSEMIPASYHGKPQAVFVAIAMGRDLGLSDMASLQNISVINGRPCVWGDAALAIARQHPQFAGIDETFEGDTAICSVFRFEREAGERHVRRCTRRTFSAAEAKRAGLTAKKGPWQDYPRRMLQLRARGFALRDAFPDALKGLGLGEEVIDAVQIVDVDEAPVELPLEADTLPVTTRVARKLADGLEEAEPETNGAAAIADQQASEH